MEMSHSAAVKAPQMAGVLGFFKDPDSLVVAMEKVKNSKHRSFDAFTPYPIHGLEHAQGLKRSILPYVAFLAGLTGILCAFGLEYWTSAVDWPLNVGGKPYNSWPAFVPIMFELTVLLSGLATAGAMLAINGLPNITKKAFDPSLTRDRFAIIIENSLTAPLDEREASEFLRQLGATEVKTVYSEGWF